MKKNRLLLSFWILAIGCLSFNAMAYSEDELVSIARKAAYSAANDVMGKVSPNTGRDADYDLDYQSIIYDPYEKEIECRVTLTWSAKKYMISTTRRTCETEGKLYINLSRGKSNMRVRYVSKNENDWFKECASSHWIDTLSQGVVIVVIN